MAVQGSITIKRLRNGDSLQMTLTSSKSLLQIFSATNNTFTPDWTNSSNQPILTAQVRSILGNAVSIVAVKWTVGGSTNIRLYKAGFASKVGASGDSAATTATSGIYTGALNSTATENTTLRIGGRPITNSSLAANVTITCTLYVSINGNEPVEVSKSVEIEYRSLATGGYKGWITATYGGKDVGMILDDDIPSLALEPHLSDVNGEMDASKFNVEWFKEVAGADSPLTNNASYTKDGKKLVVTRDHVDGKAVFYCKFKLVGSATECEADYVEIVDNTDDYNIVLSPASPQVALNETIRITPYLYNVRTGSKITVKKWTVEVKNGETMKEVTSGWSADANGVFTMNESAMYDGGAEYDPVVTWIADY